MSAPVNAQLAGSVLAEAMALPDDRARAKFYRRLAEQAMRNYTQGRAESIARAVDWSRAQWGHRFDDVRLAEATAVGKRRWSEHLLARLHADEERLYTSRAVFYASQWTLDHR